MRLVRSVGASSGTDIIWDPKTGEAEKSRFEGFDAVVHLAGDGIATGRWNERKKREIRESRALGTKNLAEILSQLQNPPSVFLTASAIGIYGNREAEVLDEQSQPGKGFLAEVCQEWEAAAQPASQKEIRTVQTRFGIILSSKGGALKKMLFPFKMGLGGIIGDGTQYMSWVALADVVGVLEKTLLDSSLKGPVNVVAPEAVNNATFTQILGDILLRPTLLPMPAFLARLAFGEMADELLLASARVTPKKLLASGYHFQFSDLKSCLEDLLSR
ncbi:MAG: Epimerase family protein [Elusimicrobia bacterium]|nr:Epimerase family protein [Elusimicrobiota bacterium]